MQVRALTAEREMLLNRIPAFVIYKDRAGYVVHANRMAALLAGRRLEALVGMHGSELFPQADPGVVARTDEEVMSTGQPKHGIVETVTHKDGSKHYFEIEVLPNFDGEGRVAGLVVFGMDRNSAGPSLGHDLVDALPDTELEFGFEDAPAPSNVLISMVFDRAEPMLQENFQQRATGGLRVSRSR